MEYLVKNNDNLHHPYVFDKNKKGVYMLGDNISSLCLIRLDSKSNPGVTAFNWLVDEGPKAYHAYTAKDEYYELIHWLWSNFDLGAHGIPESKVNEILSSKHFN